MPWYCYRCDSCGRTLEEDRRIDQRDEPTKCCCSAAMRRDLAAEHGAARGPRGEWPIESISQAVQPAQIGEAIAQDRNLGVPTDYAANGSPIFMDRSHQKRWCKAHKIQDKNDWS